MSKKRIWRTRRKLEDKDARLNEDKDARLNEDKNRYGWMIYFCVYRFDIWIMIDWNVRCNAIESG
jgi:hypothetical protein